MNSANKVIFLDTNVLLVFLIGKIGELIGTNYLNKFFKTSQYKDQYESICEVISNHSLIISNSYIFSEISHLTIYSKDFSSDLHFVLIKYIQELLKNKQLKIVETPIIDIIKNNSIYFLGFNDVSILESPEPNFSLFTFDQNLISLAHNYSNKINVIHS